MGMQRFGVQLAVLSLFAVTGIAVPQAKADAISYTGTLASSSDTFEVTLTLATTSSVVLQTFDFGGGVNHAGKNIVAGGTDPFLAIFSGTGSGSTILTDTFANPFATSLDVTNYGSFAGCPPAGAPTIGGSATCGDITMSFGQLAAGTYTVLLSDGQYIANAVFDNGTLGEGFTDFTGGQFCNLVINGASCAATGAYALDITTTSVTATPEPTSLLLLGSGLLGMAAIRRKQQSRTSETKPRRKGSTGRA